MAIRDDDETAVSTSASAGGGARRGPRFLNFDAVTTQRVAITARGGRVFELRDDFPAHILLRYQMLPTSEDRARQVLLRLREEARANGSEEASAGEGEETAETAETFEARLRREVRESVALRAAMARLAREQDEEMFDVCGDIFRFSYAQLTDGELFGSWDEARMRWDGGIFTSQEARQIVELFISLRGGAFSPPPPATEPRKTGSRKRATSRRTTSRAKSAH